MFGKAVLAATCCALLAGCGAGDDAAEQAESREPPRESVFDPLTETIDRAEGVQDTVDAQSEELRRRVEEAER